MAENNRHDLLNDAIESAMARSRGETSAIPAFQPELAALLVVAGELRDLPDPRFAERLRKELFGEKESLMEATLTAARVRPYLIVPGAAELIEFLQQTFNAEVLLRAPAPSGRLMHAEVRVGDSIVEMGDASDEWKAIAAPLHVYIDDVDAAYERALAAGATSLYPPTDQFYGDREAGIVDRFGTQWFIAKRAGSASGKPPGFSTVNTGFRAANAEQMLAFLQQAFGAIELERTTTPAGSIQHAEIRVGESLMELSEAHGEWGATTGAFHFFVDDCDAVYQRAVAAGARSLWAPEDKPYGERSGGVEDPFGNLWFIATTK
jgi:uncharacterized glyoxalase superfamily protein PhnB